MWDFAEFQKDLDHFAEVEVPTQFKRRQIEIILFLFRRVVHYTPVHDPTLGKDKNIPGGHARSNWQVDTLINNNVLGTRQEPIELIDEETIRGNLSKMRVGEKLYVFNNVRYIQALEDGNSIDPSKGYMVLQAIEEVKEYMATKGW